MEEELDDLFNKVDKQRDNLGKLTNEEAEMDLEKPLPPQIDAIAGMNK